MLEPGDARRRRTLWVIAVVGLTVIIAACGGADAPETSDEATISSAEVETQSEERAAETDTGAPAEASTTRSEPEQRPEQRGRDSAPSDATEPQEEAEPEASAPASDEASEETASEPAPDASVEVSESDQAGAPDQASEEAEADTQAEPDASTDAAKSDPADGAIELNVPDWVAEATEVQVRRGTPDAGTRFVLLDRCPHCVQAIISWWHAGPGPRGAFQFFGGVLDFRWADTGPAALDCGYCPWASEGLHRPPNFYWSADGGVTWGVLPLPEPSKWIWTLGWRESATRWVASREPAIVDEDGLLRPTGEPQEWVLLPDLTVFPEPPRPPEPPPQGVKVDGDGREWTVPLDGVQTRLLRDGELVMDFAPCWISSWMDPSPSGERLLLRLYCSGPRELVRWAPNTALVAIVETRTGSPMILRVPLEEYRGESEFPVEPPGFGGHRPPSLNLRWESDELLRGTVGLRPGTRPVALHLESLTLEIYTGTDGPPDGMQNLLATIPVQTQERIWAGDACLERFWLPRADQPRPDCVPPGTRLTETNVTAVYPDGTRWLFLEAEDGTGWVPETTWRAGAVD